MFETMTEAKTYKKEIEALKGDNMTELRNKLKNSLYRLNKWDRLADLAQAEWDKDPMNEDREEAANRYYELQFNEFLYAANLLYKFAGGKLTENECNRLLHWSNRRKIMGII